MFLQFKTPELRLSAYAIHVSLGSPSQETLLDEIDDPVEHEKAGERGEMQMVGG